MCGRYTLIRFDSVVDILHNLTLPADLHLVSRFNIAPTQDILAIANRAEPTAQLMHWGLVPSWATDLSIGNRMINARAETLAEKPAFKNALHKRRCIIPADGFYEWRKNPDGSKTPLYIRLKSKAPFAFAGLYENWTSPHGELITSCTIITTTPNALMKPIHDRMPVILPKSAIPDWLNPKPESPEKLLPLLKPYPAEEMLAHPVSRRVNSPTTQTPDLTTPVPEEDHSQPPSPAPEKKPPRTRKPPPSDPDQPTLF